MKKNFNLFRYLDLIIRPINSTDIDETLQWRNFSEHCIWFNRTEPLSKKIHYEWFQQYLLDDSDLTFIICNEKNEKCGQFSIYNINWSTKRAEFGRFLVNPFFKGQGIMKKSCRAAINLARDNLKLNFLYLEVKKNNEKAIYIYKNSGFIVSGINEKDNLTMKIDLS